MQPYITFTPAQIRLPKQFVSVCSVFFVSTLSLVPSSNTILFDHTHTFICSSQEASTNEALERQFIPTHCIHPNLLFGDIHVWRVH